ncbi:MAG: Abi family protein [Ignavibacteriales bacterium]|nr:Abi family protein [Ignavibacteriales bacterium]
MSRYLAACNNNSKKAMTLYRLNLRLSQELFTIISCFEIALRNEIDRLYSVRYGADWLRDSIETEFFFKSKKLAD